MPYNTKQLKTDVNGKPVPQLFNDFLDDYEPLLGRNGAMRTLLYDVNGNPLLTDTNAGYVRAADGMIAAIGALADAAVTDPALAASVIAALKGLLTDIGQTGDALVAAGAAGSVSAKLRRLTTDLSTLLTQTDAVETSLSTLVTQTDTLEGSISATTDAKADTGNGSLNAVLKSLRDTGIRVKNSVFAIKAASVTGAKTISTTAAELFAGASRLANRYAMVVYNESNQIVYRSGQSTVTTSMGFPLLPGDVVILTFDPNVSTPYYFIAAASASVRVEELA